VASLGIHGAYVAVIDDLATRELPADLIINGAYHAERLAYRARPETRFLLGPRYVLLHPDFAEESPRVARPVVERALISLGGDPDGTRLAETVATVQRELPEAMIDVVVGPFADAVGSCGPRVRVHRGLPSIRPLLLEADLAVSAAGMTLYECLAVGTPAVTLCVADNQKPNFEELARAGLVVPGEPDLAGAVGALARSVSRRETLCAKGRAVVDGRGASRVAAELTTFVTTSRVGGAAR
jgi:spore coat polysaccharide biosynthesis predicted glycosyltransferase SpsG